MSEVVGALVSALKLARAQFVHTTEALEDVANLLETHLGGATQTLTSIRDRQRTIDQMTLMIIDDALKQAERSKAALDDLDAAGSGGLR